MVLLSLEVVSSKKRLFGQVHELRGGLKSLDRDGKNIIELDKQRGSTSLNRCSFRDESNYDAIEVNFIIESFLQHTM